MRTILFTLVSYLGQVLCQNSPPVFVKNMHRLSISETVDVGTSVYTLSATDETAVTYSTDSELFDVNPITGVVRLDRKLDYDAGTKVITVRVMARDSQGLETTADPTVNILDANDNPPTFNDTTYQTTLSEDAPVNSVVIDNLHVTDKDYTGSLINISCNPNAVPNATATSLKFYREACETFSLVRTASSNKYWRGKVYLQKQLDYEKRGSYQIPVESYDGLNRGLQSIEILVADVEDSPPVFINVTDTIEVQENSPIGGLVGQAIARDGDGSNPRDIVYEMTKCPERGTRKDGRDKFRVDTNTGAIHIKSEIDRENDLFLGGVLLCVKAREVINATTVGDDNTTTAVTTIQVDVLDLNDEVPVFNTTNYNTSIYEDIPDGSPVPGVALTISDKDMAPSNIYNIRLKNYNDIFELFPSSGLGVSIASIKVTNSSKIDYESAVKKYELYVIVEEVTNIDIPRPQTATVTVHVLDRNDNSPKFYNDIYSASVFETDPGNVSIIRHILALDPDSGWMGTSGLNYSLLGSGYDLFEIIKNSRRGLEIRVKPCDTPGRGKCIDYERRRRYDFTLVAADMQGDPRGRQGAANLTIHIKDVNDNTPMFRLNSYRAYIFEGQAVTVDSLIVNSDDIDTLGEVSYRLATSNQSRYWRIDPLTGNITALQAIYNLHTPDNRGWFDLVVIADDTANEARVDVRIDVIEVNTFTPFFTNLDNTTSIREDIAPNSHVFTVSAVDNDPATSTNGQVQFTIEFGARGMFMVDLVSGTVSTQTDAAFDFDTEQQYILTILVRDGGTPQRTGTGTLTVNVLDLNNKLPYFTPTVQISSIPENAPINTLVTTIRAEDLDRNHVLVFHLVEPVTAINPDGMDVDRGRVDYTKLFRVENTTGNVYVASSLDRDLTSIVTYTMTVTDVYDPNNPQVGERGQLQINILEYNDQSPEFLVPVYNLTVEEEQSIGTFIIALVARDEDDEIDRYEIVDGNRDFFLLTPDTGELNVRRRLDYETLKRVEFTVQAWDTGSPSRSGTARVIVSISNINDNSPLPFESTYYETVPEHSPAGTSLLQVSATDADEGDYGVVRYSLPPTVTQFNIDNFTGVLTMSDTGEFDREKTQVITTTVIIYDSPLDGAVRRSSSVQVYVTLSDINDNAPVFSSSEFISTQIIESIDIGAQVLQVSATDRDEGINALLLYEKVPGSGDPEGLFVIGARFGRITVARSLRGKVGSYVFRVTAKDRNGIDGYLVGYSTVNITIIESLNSPPVWYIPASDNFTVEALESQYLGMMVFDAHANDSNSGNNGIVEYFFQVSGKEVSRTREFSINRVTGVIRAEVVFDRELVDRYTLHLVAKDKGSRPLIAERFFNVKIADVNDNAPEFPMEDGVVKDVNIIVAENLTVNSLVGAVTATDRDLSNFTNIFYHIIAGGKGKFAVGLKTGEITLIETVDREEQEVYSLEIRATNDEDVDNSEALLLYHTVDPSVVTVIVTLLDVNDVKPYFINYNGPRTDVLEYYGFVYSDAAFDKGIVQVSATDDDYDDVSRITYDISSGNDEGLFGINRNGLVTNQKLLDGHAGHVFTIVASATDQKWTATALVKVFVADRGHEAKIVVNRNQEDMAAVTPQLIRKLESMEGIDYAGVTRVTNHVASSVVSSKSDVYVVGAVALPDGRYRLLSSSQLLALISADRERSRVPYDDLGVSAIGASDERGAWYNRTPVLASLIIVLLLIVLAIVLLLLACCCINELDRMRIKPTDKESSTGDEAILVDNAAYVSGPMVTGEDETDLKKVPTEEIYAAVVKPKPAHCQSVTYDPQPFVEEEEEPVIETEVDDSIGEGAGRPLSIPPDYDDDDGDDYVVIEASIQGSVMESPRYDQESVVIDTSVDVPPSPSPVPSPSHSQSLPSSPLPSPPASMLGSHESLSFDMEEATKLYTVKTHDDVDFHSTVLEPVEERSEDSSQLNTTNPDQDGDSDTDLGAPLNSSTLKKPADLSPSLENEEAVHSFGQPWQASDNDLSADPRSGEEPVDSNSDPGNMSSRSQPVVSLARAPGFQPQFGRSLQFGSSLQSRHHDPNDFAFDGTVDPYALENPSLSASQ